MSDLARVVRENNTLCLDPDSPGWGNACGYLFDERANALHFPISKKHLTGRDVERFEVLIWSQPRVIVTGRLETAHSQEDAERMVELARRQGMDPDAADQMIFDQRTHRPRRVRHQLLISDLRLAPA